MVIRISFLSELAERDYWCELMEILSLISVLSILKNIFLLNVFSGIVRAFHGLIVNLPSNIPGGFFLIKLVSIFMISFANNLILYSFCLLLCLFHYPMTIV